MFKEIPHNRARSYIWAMAAEETGLEWTADVVYIEEPLRETAGTRISHMAYDIRKRQRVWTAVPMGSGLTMNE
jgi:hypothetical protein